MTNPDYSKLSEKQLLEWFDKERQEWLSAGMSEEAIRRAHYGEKKDKGKGGDYRIWLDERKHKRADHKYAPGTPVTFDTTETDDIQIFDEKNGIEDAEFNIDLELALATLTKSQRFCFVSVMLDGRTQQSVADELGIKQQNVDKHISAAKKKIKKFFHGRV